MQFRSQENETDEGQDDSKIITWYDLWKVKAIQGHIYVIPGAVIYWGLGSANRLLA
jgi:hypothetical protein